MTDLFPRALPLAAALPLLALAPCAAAQGFAAELVAPGVVSGARSDYNPVLTATGDTLYFVRGGADFSGQKILRAHRVAGGWSEPREVEFSDARWGDSDLTLSADGTRMWFSSKRPIDGGTAERRDYDVWAAEMRDGRWGAPSHVPALSSPQPDFGPEMRGDTLWLNSYRAGGLGASDLYRAVRGDGGWTVAHVGAPLSGPSHEADPVVSPDGRFLVFVAWDRPGGAGEGDLYAARRTADGGWSEPVSLGPAVNTAAFELTPSFSPDGAWLWFASFRAAPDAAPGAAGADVYRIRVADLPALR
jgi:hypothetical protein